MQLLYAGDFRPFFTIHDSDFNKYTDSEDIPSSVILGATNPFFMKALQHWPNRLTIGYTNEKGKAQGSFGNFKQELKTSYKPCLGVEQSVLKKLTPLGKAKSAKGTLDDIETLPQLYSNLTAQMLTKPITRYYGGTLQPRQRSS